MTIETGVQGETGPRTEKPLRLFRGTFIPGVHFTSGYSVWVFDFTSVPDGVDPFIDVWITTPDGERILYVEPDEAIETVQFYHLFDRTVGSRITREQPTSGTARVRLDADDGTSFELDLEFEQTVGTRILNAVSALTPRTISRSRFGGMLGTRVLNWLVEANGMKAHGQTDSGIPYQFEGERISVIKDTSATLNGEDLGTPSRAPQPIAFGDIKNMPLYIHGKAYLPIPGPEPAEPAELNQRED